VRNRSLSSEISWLSFLAYRPPSILYTVSRWLQIWTVCHVRNEIRLRSRYDMGTTGRWTEEPIWYIFHNTTK